MAMSTSSHCTSGTFLQPCPSQCLRPDFSVCHISCWDSSLAHLNADGPLWRSSAGHKELLLAGQVGCSIPNLHCVKSVPSCPHHPQSRQKLGIPTQPFGKGNSILLRKFLPSSQHTANCSLVTLSYCQITLFFGSLPLCLDSKYMASRAICQCLCLDKQSVSILVYGFSWDQLCVLSPLNGRAVCKHLGIKPSGACLGPTADLPGARQEPSRFKAAGDAGLLLRCYCLHRYQPPSCPRGLCHVGVSLGPGPLCTQKSPPDSRQVLPYSGMSELLQVVLLHTAEAMETTAC